MSVTVLADGSDGSVGVLVDDPVCGRLLLDCGPGVPGRAAFAGLPLAGVRVLCSSEPGSRDRLDTGVPEAALVEVEDVAGARAYPLGEGQRAIVLSTSDGVLLHYPSPRPLAPEQLAELPPSMIDTLPRSRPELAGRELRLLPSRRRVLITGGARSGKSALAERRLAGGPALYLATGPTPGPDDPEWQVRVQAHRDRRPPGWTTTETTDAAGLLRGTDPVPVLFDCVGTWLTAMMDRARIWDGRGDNRLAEAIEELVLAWQRTGRTVVAVTNEVGSGVVPATPAGGRFRDELGRLNARLAAGADEVWTCTAGIGQRLK